MIFKNKKTGEEIKNEYFIDYEENTIPLRFILD
jgi:hypothetical protein